MDEYNIRELRPPLGEKDLVPLSPGCRVVQTTQMLSDQEFASVAHLLESRPDVGFRVYLWEFEDLEFLRFFPRLTRFFADTYKLRDLSGLRHLAPNVVELGIAETERPLSIEPIRRFTHLETIYFEGGHKQPEIIGELTSLTKLAIRSTKLKDLKSLTSLRNLRVLELRLGSALDLSPLVEFDRLRYLEIWMMRGLEDILPIGNLRALRCLFLQDLPRVSRLPDMSRMESLLRVHIDHLRGLTNLEALTHAPHLRDIRLSTMRHLTPDMVRPLLALRSLRTIWVGTGSPKRNRQIQEMFNLPENKLRPDWDEILTD